MFNRKREVYLRYGKKPARIDKRTISLSAILKALPPPPPSFSVDASLGVTVPEQMFGNDTWGDCVIAARANQTLRMEYLQQKKILGITAQQCLKEYWREEGGCAAEVTHPDDGLDALTSLNEWRQSGWKVGGHTYKIYAFASALTQLDVEFCIQYLGGAQMGMQVPASAMDQFKAGQPWTVVPGSPSEGGHMIYLESYVPAGPVAMTWARKQPMTWDFFNTYRDESYGVIPLKDAWQPNSPIDDAALDALLEEITA